MAKQSSEKRQEQEVKNTIINEFQIVIMQLLKPAWVADEGHALMSIDIHPDGTRFVTGGQGTDCGRVCIWNLRPVLDANVSKDKSVPKLLTQVL